MPLQRRKERVDSDRHRIRFRKLKVSEERVKDRNRNHVLGDHLDGILLRYAGIERVAQTREEDLEALAYLLIILHEQADALDVALGDARDVCRPGIPVDARAALLDKRCVHRALPALYGEEREAQLHALGNLRSLALLLLLLGEQAVVPSLVPLGVRVVAFVSLRLLLQRKRIDACLDALVMGA